MVDFSVFLLIAHVSRLVCISVKDTAVIQWNLADPACEVYDWFPGEDFLLHVRFAGKSYADAIAFSWQLHLLGYDVERVSEIYGHIGTPFQNAVILTLHEQKKRVSYSLEKWSKSS